MNILLNILEVLSHLSETQTTILFLICMALIGFAIWVMTASILIALLTAELINIWNLTIIITEPLLLLGTKPFMPLWISLILFITPFVYLLFIYIPSKHMKED